MKRVALTLIKDHLSKFLRIAEKDAVTITRHPDPESERIGFSGKGTLK